MKHTLLHKVFPNNPGLGYEEIVSPVMSKITFRYLIIMVVNLI